MSRKLIALLIIGLVIVVLPQLYASGAEAHSEGLDITVRNITGGQPITPPIVIIHDGSVDIVPDSAESMEGLEELAEAGEQQPLIDTLSGMTGVKSIYRLGNLILPGAEDTLAGVGTVPGDSVTVIAMLACTNDAITVGTALVPHLAALPAMSSGGVYDAGTETNDETAATVPCLEGEGVSNADSEDGEGSVTHHPGIAGSADLGLDRNWEGPAIQIFVTDHDEDAPAGVQVGLTLDNLTSGQPLTPPVAVAHDRNVNVFHYTMPSELDGIDDLSEGGAQGDLIASLGPLPGVLSVQGLDSGGPITPGTSFSANIEAVDGAAVSVAAMFACTNDACIVATVWVDVSDGQVDYTNVIAPVFDSGAENNDETAATVPCLGGEDAAFSEGVGENVRMTHPGISGDADLSPVTHGWTDETTARLSLHGPARDLQVTVRNITAGQPITPPLVVVHRNDIDPLPIAGEFPRGLEELAEAGEQQPLMDTLRRTDGVRSVTGFDALILPGGLDTLTDITAGVGDHVTVIATLACTNHAITIGTTAVPMSGAPAAMSGGRVYDAGTEKNAETSATVPCLGGEGVSQEDGEGIIARHAGISGVGDLDESRTWSGPAMQFTVDANGAAVPEASMAIPVVRAILTVENLTSGQPITPPVVVVHDRNLNVFDYTMPSELDGIDDLSEAGATGDLIATLRARPGVVSVRELDTGGPIPPGTSFVTEVEVVDGAAVTVAGMFACTNDGYIVATVPADISDGTLRPSSVLAQVFDSGAENNDETTGTIPCLGGGPAAFSDGFGENARAMHPGISGGADLNVETHGWSAETTASVTIGAHSDEAQVAPSPPADELPDPPVTGDYAPSQLWVFVAGAIGLLVALVGATLTLRCVGRRII